MLVMKALGKNDQERVKKCSPTKKQEVKQLFFHSVESALQRFEN